MEFPYIAVTYQYIIVTTVYIGYSDIGYSDILDIVIILDV